MSEELEPCPFCGGTARLLKGGPGNCFVRCDNCSAGSDDGSEERVAAAWNRRAPSPNMREAMDALKVIAGMTAAPTSSDDHTRLHKALDKLDEARDIARTMLRSLTGAKP